eukprot:1046415-Amphidinium_carterae.1
MPTQFDGRNPQFREWSEEVKAYLTIHNVHIEDSMEESAKSMEAIELCNIQDAYTEEDVNLRRDQKYPAQPTEDDQYELTEYSEMSLAIRKWNRNRNYDHRWDDNQ